MRVTSNYQEWERIFVKAWNFLDEWLVWVEALLRLDLFILLALHTVEDLLLFLTCYSKAVRKVHSHTENILLIEDDCVLRVKRQRWLTIFSLGVPDNSTCVRAISSEDWARNFSCFFLLAIQLSYSSPWTNHSQPEVQFSSWVCLCS